MCLELLLWPISMILSYHLRLHGLLDLSLVPLGRLCSTRRKKLLLVHIEWIQTSKFQIIFWVGHQNRLPKTTQTVGLGCLFNVGNIHVTESSRIAKLSRITFITECQIAIGFRE